MMAQDAAPWRCDNGRMFDKLTERLAGAVDSLRGRGRLTEDNIADTLRQVRELLQDY